MKKIYSLIAVLLCSTIMLTGCGNKKLKCSKDYSDTYGNNIKMTQDVDVDFKNDKIQKFVMNMNFELPDSFESYASNYLEQLKSQYESTYGKYNGITVTVNKTSDMKFTISVNVDYKKLSTTDKTTLKISGSEKYSDNKISFEQQGYTCK